MEASSFDDVVGHDQIKRVLLMNAERPAPGYLFVGPEGVGKHRVAERFARLLLNMENDAPLSAHPDAMVVERQTEARDIGVEQIRELVQRMRLSAARGGRKVALVVEADRLNEEACNALLKAVEEATDATTYIFIAERAERLPDTLRSRLVPVSFFPLRPLEIQTWLQQQGAGETEASACAQASQGCPGRALSLWREADVRRERERRIERWQDFFTQNLGQRCQSLEQMQQRAESTEDPAASWREELRAGMDMCRLQSKSSPREAVRVGLGLAQAWQMIGSSISPRFVIEWNLTRYALDETAIPSVYARPYLKHIY